MPELDHGNEKYKTHDPKKEQGTLKLRLLASTNLASFFIIRVVLRPCPRYLSWRSRADVGDRPALHSRVLYDSSQQEEDIS